MSGQTPTALNDKQAAFVNEYLVDLNATQAAIRAGCELSATSSYRFYTYLLVDPRDDAIFYVGKGSGNRVKCHVAAIRNNRPDNPLKGERIALILKSGLAVREIIFSTHEKEDRAYAVEAALIGALPNLTNIARGVTTDARKAAAQARICLLGMKTFDEWIETARPERLASAVEVFGSYRECYDFVRVGFEEFAA